MPLEKLNNDFFGTAEFITNSVDTPSFIAKFEDFFSLIVTKSVRFGKLMSFFETRFTALPSATLTFILHIVHIVRNGSDKKVRRINALRVITMMEQLKAIRDFTVMMKPRVMYFLASKRFECIRNLPTRIFAGNCLFKSFIINSKLFFSMFHKGVFGAFGSVSIPCPMLGGYPHR